MRPIASSGDPVALDKHVWSTNIDNPFLPLVPGTVFTYQGTSDHETEVDRVHVTHRTKLITGVECVVVEDTAYVAGLLEEATLDWYAQDEAGNVWYFGEDTKEFDADGNVISTQGSWEAGVDGAQPGIVMEAGPEKGDQYQQEYAPGVAEDMAEVLGLQSTVNVPYGHFGRCLKTREWTPLEPGVEEWKFYATGIGFVKSAMIHGGQETSALVSVTSE